jgi:porphobilinogen synthase
MGRVAAAPARLSRLLKQRPRRLRRSAAMRALVRETRLAPQQLVMPMFVIEGHDREQPIPSLPGHSRLSSDRAVAVARDLAKLGVGGVLLFGIPDVKDDEGRAAADPGGPVAVTLRAMREAGLPLVLAADVCLCEYTTHGHCGVIRRPRAGRDSEVGEVDNDATLPLLAEAAVCYAAAGADLVGPSGMMDGQVAAIREGLDEAGHQGTAIVAYASKAASAFYGPFREAAGSAPAFGDRRGYQMDFANGREALREMELDAAEGADILMVKPALTSLDLLARARTRFDLPLAAYHVSGEVAMLEAAAARGWIDRRAAALETLTAIARAGADIVITYLAADAALWLQEA